MREQRQEMVRVRTFRRNGQTFHEYAQWGALSPEERRSVEARGARPGKARAAARAASPHAAGHDSTDSAGARVARVFGGVR